MRDQGQARSGKGSEGTPKRQEERMLKAGDFRVGGTNPEELTDGCSRSVVRLYSSARPLRALLLRVFRAAGLLRVLRESRSLYHRIRIQERNGWDTRGLLFAEIRESLPPLSVRACRNPEQMCIAGTQALCRARPWLAIGDLELFLQGWLQAEKCLLHTSDSERRKEEQYSVVRS